MTLDVRKGGDRSESESWDVICRDDDQSGTRVRYLSYDLNTGRAMVRDYGGRTWKRIPHDGHTDRAKRGTYVWAKTTLRESVGPTDFEMVYENEKG
jgi:hypothetical protein